MSPPTTVRILPRQGPFGALSRFAMGEGGNYDWYRRANQAAAGYSALLRRIPSLREPCRQEVVRWLYSPRAAGTAGSPADHAYAVSVDATTAASYTPPDTRQFSSPRRQERVRELEGINAELERRIQDALRRCPPPAAAALIRRFGRIPLSFGWPT